MRNHNSREKRFIANKEREHALEREERRHYRQHMDDLQRSSNALKSGHGAREIERRLRQKHPSR